MESHEWLAERFEENRAHLRTVAFRMLGSMNEADDAVQEAWLRLSRSDTSEVENLRGWLTTVVGRVCLNMLRARTSRREEPLETLAREPVFGSDGQSDPEQEALTSDSVGLALLVVLETLHPEERLAFVLHDMFAVPFNDIAPIVGRSPDAARQLASRARRRVQGSSVPETDPTRQREVVDAFLAAARTGDFVALVAVLDPDVMLRADRTAARGTEPVELRGAEAVASGALGFSGLARVAKPTLVNGSPGLAVTSRGRVFVVVVFTVREDRIVELEAIGDRERLDQLDLTLIDS